jgi:hypothetical protein
MTGEQTVAALDALIERVRTLPKVVDEALPDLAEIWGDRMRATIAAGTSPTGEAWKPTARGERALKDAADALHIAVYKGKIFVRLTGVEARHHRGAVRGRVTRQIIPRELPPEWRDDALRVFQKTCHAHLALGTGGGKP